MPEKDFTKKIHRLASDVDTLLQQVQKTVTKIVADAVDIKDSLDEVKDKFKKPEEDG